MADPGSAVEKLHSTLTEIGAHTNSGPVNPQP